MDQLKKKKVLFLSSSGGHFAQLMKLEPLFDLYDYKVITDDVPSTRPLKNDYNIEFFGKKSRGRGVGMFMNLLKYSWHALREFISSKPDVIITTGNYPAVPFCYIGKLFGIKIVYILSFARVTSKSKSADLIYKISDQFIVQWESCLQNYPGGRYLGGGLY